MNAPADQHQRRLIGRCKPVEVIWVGYVILLALLAFADTCVGSGAKLNGFIDRAILLIAVPGSVVIAMVTAWLAWEYREEYTSRTRGMRLGVCGFVGPLAAFVLVLWINARFNGDIDGGMLLYYLPLLAILLPVIVMPLSLWLWERTH